MNGRIIYYPFIALFLMLVARNAYFDRWTWLPGLTVLFILNLFFVFYCAIQVRAAASAVKKAALDTLAPKIAAATVRDDKPRKATLEVIRSRIENERGGAYANFYQDPTIVAVLIPSGGFGILVILFKYFFGFG